MTQVDVLHQNAQVVKSLRVASKPSSQAQPARIQSGAGFVENGARSVSYEPV
ncbi:MAG: hypothetical protein IGS23_00890 [Rivularia sp. T60_A2020_040]|nr:hypothetical protein [Rivularia sp. T60_A2020_040]